MAVVHYNDGTEYGQVDAFYGRVSSSILAAQITQFRETGLKVKLIDERTNRWEFLAGVDQNPTPYAANPEFTTPWLQTYWSYRGQADVCILDNGNIFRVRVDVDDLNIYSQTITDPTVASQWTTWGLLYSGPHYGVGLAADGNTPIVYGIKADGLYRNNSLVWATAGLVQVHCHRNADGKQDVDHLWIQKTLIGAFAPNRATQRKFDVYHTPDVQSTTPLQVPWNFLWMRHRVASIERADGKIIRVSSYPIYAPEALSSGDTLLTELVNLANIRTELKGPQLVRGLPGQWGHNTVSGSEIFKLSDGYYYLLYVEVHRDGDWEFVSNLETPLVWQRSKDGLFWSEPVHCGFNAWGFAGLVEKNGYVYVAGNGSVHRRPTTSVEYDLTNYVPTVEWESPRANQSGSGSLVSANPGGIHNSLIDNDNSDRRIVIEPGIKSGANYEFVKLDDFWVKKIRRIIDGKINRLQIEFGNIWSRLENPLRDVVNFVGRTEYQDWLEGKPNEAFAYFFDGGEGSDGSSFTMDVTGGLVLWTGWKGLNPEFSVSLSAPSSSSIPIALFFRYIDDNNHIKVQFRDGFSNNIVVSEVENGTARILTTLSASGITRFGIRARWKTYDIYANGTLVGSVTDDSPVLKTPGYVGWSCNRSYIVSNFDFKDLEHNYTTEDIVRFALAGGDYHDVVVGSQGSKQYALMWGPQTDLPTLADGLRNTLEADKLELIWRDGIIEVGQFKDETVYKDIENRIIRTEQIQLGNRRINLANIDGNENTWFEIDIVDALLRDRMINAYLDLPELLTQDDVRNRAIEEIRRGKMAEAPGGQLPLFFDLWRMDTVRWVDNAGNSQIVRIEGMKVSIDQGSQPSQRQELDTSLIDNE